MDVRREEAEIVGALYKVGNVSKDELDKATAQLKAAETQLAQVKSGKPWQPAKEAEPANYDDALARLTREEQIAKMRVEAGIAPVSAIAEARRQRLRLQWTFGPKEKRAEVAAEMAKTLRELAEVAATLRRERRKSGVDELDVHREMVLFLPAAEAAKERQFFMDHARQTVATLETRQEAAVISKYEVLRGAATALEALLSIETE